MKKIVFNCYNCIKVNGQKIKYNNGDIIEMNDERADFFINRGVATLYIEPTEEKEVIQKIIEPKTTKKIINTKTIKKTKLKPELKNKINDLKSKPCCTFHKDKNNCSLTVQCPEDPNNCFVPVQSIGGAFYAACECHEDIGIIEVDTSQLLGA